MKLRRSHRPSTRGHTVTEERITTTPVDMTLTIDKLKHVAFQTVVLLTAGMIVSILLMFIYPALPLEVVCLPLLLGAWPITEEFMHSRSLQRSRNRAERAKAHREQIITERAYQEVLDTDGDGQVSSEERAEYERQLVFFLTRIIDMKESTTKRTWCDPPKLKGKYNWSPDLWKAVRQDCVDAGIFYLTGAERQRAHLVEKVKTLNQAITMLENAGKFEETNPNDHRTKVGPSSKNSVNPIATDNSEPITTLPPSYPDYEMEPLKWE